MNFTWNGSGDCDTDGWDYVYVRMFDRSADNMFAPSRVTQYGGAETWDAFIQFPTNATWNINDYNDGQCTFALENSEIQICNNGNRIVSGQCDSTFNSPASFSTYWELPRLTCVASIGSYSAYEENWAAGPATLNVGVEALYISDDNPGSYPDNLPGFQGFSSVQVSYAFNNGVSGIQVPVFSNSAEAGATVQLGTVYPGDDIGGNIEFVLEYDAGQGIQTTLCTDSESFVVPIPPPAPEPSCSMQILVNGSNDHQVRFNVEEAATFSHIYYHLTIERYWPGTTQWESMQMPINSFNVNIVDEVNSNIPNYFPIPSSGYEFNENGSDFWWYISVYFSNGVADPGAEPICQSSWQNYPYPPGYDS